MLDMVLINPIAIAARDNLKDFKEIADKVGMRFMLMEGNLLGAYREKGIIKGDEDDMDLGIMDNEFSKFPQVIDELLKKGFVERKRVVINNELHGGCWERNGNHIDIMRMIKDKGLVYNVGDGGALRYDYSADIFSEYGKIDFLGLEVDTVGDIEKFLTERYGDWKVKNPNYSYKDPVSSPSVSDNRIIEHEGIRFIVRQNSWDENVLRDVVSNNCYKIGSPKVFVDIGAHIGGSSLLASKNGAVVYAYEPSLLNFNQLKKNVALNGYDIKIFNKGVSDNTGKGKLYHHPYNFGCFSLNKDNTTDMQEDGEDADFITIQEVFKDIEHCDILKIDCEGAEERFYRDIPFEKIDVIVIETHRKGTKIREYLSQFYEVHGVHACRDYSLLICLRKKHVNILDLKCKICGGNVYAYKRKDKWHPINLIVCSSCGAQQRHMFIWEHLKDRELGKTLHISPMKCLANKIREKTDEYITGDFPPRESISMEMAQENLDLRKTRFENEEFDTIILSHVIDAIKEENDAIQELHRILKKDGTIFLVAPIYPEEKTTELSEPMPESTGGHWRRCGLDYFDRYKKMFNCSVHEWEGEYLLIMTKK